MFFGSFAQSAIALFLLALATWRTAFGSLNGGDFSIPHKVIHKALLPFCPNERFSAQTDQLNILVLAHKKVLIRRMIIY